MAALGPGDHHGYPIGVVEDRVAGRVGFPKVANRNVRMSTSAVRADLAARLQLPTEVVSPRLLIGHSGAGARTTVHSELARPTVPAIAQGRHLCRRYTELGDQSVGGLLRRNAGAEEGQQDRRRFGAVRGFRLGHLPGSEHFTRFPTKAETESAGLNSSAFATGA